MNNTNIFSFETKRLNVFNWRDYRSDTNELAKAIEPITTPKVMKTLPPNWNNIDSNKAREDWIREREYESYCLSVCDKQDKELIGILLLARIDGREDTTELRLGYLIGEHFWGRGYASEMINGLCEFVDFNGVANSITGGVDPLNTASVKVLTKNGFVKNASESSDTTHFYNYSCTRLLR